MKSRYFGLLPESFLVPLLFILPGVLFAESPEIASGERFVGALSKEPSIEEVVHFVLENNNQVHLQQIEIAKSDTDAKKLDSIYTPNVYFDASSYVKKDKDQFSSILVGNATNQDTYAVGYSQLLPTGTYVQLELSDSRYDSNAGQGLEAYALMGELALLMQQPAVHTGALTLSLSQELLKDGFGYNQRKQQDIVRNNTKIQRETLTYQLSQLVVKAMVDYWNLAVQQENVETRILLKNSIAGIRNITTQKMRYGLAEGFQLNQWNALLAQAETSVDEAMQKKNSTEREFLRIMNLDPDHEIGTSPQLKETIPEGMDLEMDTRNALETRPDLKNLKLQIDNIKMSKEIAENNLLPSVTLNGMLSSRDQGTRSLYSYKAVPSGTYPEASVQLRVEYPLWDEGTQVDLRNANLSLRQLEIQKEELSRSITDEMKDAYENIETGYRALEKAKYSVEQTRSFYANILQGYRQGRFDAEALKNALDALFQARFALLQAKIGFNISLVNYDMKSNRLWEKYNVDIDYHIDRLAGIN